MSHKRWLLLIYCIAAFLLNVWICMPGFMSPDTVDIYDQAATGSYHDWHPPAMALLWSLLDKIHRGPLLMLVLQLSFFWASVYLFATNVKSRLAIVFVVLLSVAPFIHNFSGYIGKDVQMSFSWLLAMAIMYRCRDADRQKNITAIIVFLLLVYGTLLRSNALAGAVPLFVFYTWYYFRNLKPLARVGITVMLVGLTALLQFAVVPAVAKVEHRYPQAKLYLHDMTGIYTATGKSYYPAAMIDADIIDTTNYRCQYNTATFDNLWWGKYASVNTQALNDTNVAALKTAWKQAILENTGTYLSNRYDGFLHYLRIKYRNAELNKYFLWIHPNIHGFKVQGGRLYDRYAKNIVVYSDNIFFIPWVWLLLNIVLLFTLPLVRHRIAKSLFATLLVSSLCYTLPQFFIFQIDTDFRYFYWTCISVSFAVVVLLADRLVYKN